MKFSYSGLLGRSVVVGAVLAMGYSAQADGVKVGGYADAQVRVSNGGTSGGITNSFYVNEGAVYLSGEMGDASAMVDIPFFGRNAGNNTFTLGTTKAQAYVGYKYDGGFNWRLGQFDTIYGFEANDTASVAFSNQGIVFNNALPLTHTGLLLGYDLNDQFGLKAMVSNPQNQGVMGTSSPEYGLQLAMKTDQFRGSVGGLLGSSGGTTTYLIDVVFGTDFGGLALDMEFDARNSGATTGIGILANLLYGFSDSMKGGVRGEFTSNLGSSQAFQVTAGPQFMMTKNMTVKVDYTFNSTTQVAGAAAALSHIGVLAGVYSF